MTVHLCCIHTEWICKDEEKKFQRNNSERIEKIVNEGNEGNNSEINSSFLINVCV